MSARLTILGPVEVQVAGQRLPGLAPRHRAVLAYLLLHAGTVVSIDRLIGAVWDADPPDTARAQIHAAATAIRRVLRTASATGVLLHQSGGYAAIPEPGQLDLTEFTEAVAAASEQIASGDSESAASELRAALALWRGDALADVTAAYAAGARARLAGRRLAALEQLAEVELSLGRHAELIEELAAEVAAQPMRERLSGQLMLALHRTGRQADALAVARGFRAALAEDQGLDPSRVFAILEQAILQDDPSLDYRPIATGSGPVGLPGQRRMNFLPYDTPDFAGRAAELGQLARAANDGAATVWLIDGMAGAGKTTLAVHAAHQLAGQFPDGQLFIDLHAHTPGREPIEPRTALEMLLRQLGVAAERIPDSLADRSALWRAELSGRRVIAVLDNAADSRHVHSLLPGASPSLFLITSRIRLAGLDGAGILPVGLLPADDSVGLLSRIVGDRADSEPLAVLDVLQLCGFLPLAMRIAAARLQHRPHWTVSYLASRLRDQRRRLAELAAEDRSVAVAFTVSYQHLHPAQQRAFRLLGLHPGRDIDAAATAALAGLDLQEAETLLEDLLDAHMLLQHEPGRYTFHDLLREHARTIVSAVESAAVRDDAVTRLLDYYLHTAGLAMNLLFPLSTQHRPELPEAAPAAAHLTDAGQAISWLDAERGNLVVAGAHAATGDWPAHASLLAATLYGYLYDYGHHTDALTLHTHALNAGQRLGDEGALAITLISLAWVSFRLGRYGEADEQAQQALAVCRAVGDRYGEARALNVLGNLSSRQHNYGHAHRYFQHALDFYSELGERAGVTHALGNLGIVHERQGQYQQAHDYLRQALALYQELGDQRLEEAIARTHLGVVCRHLGRYREARDHHRLALQAFRELGNRSEEADARNGLGEAAYGMGDPGQAVADHDAALALARMAGNRLELGRAFAGLARAHQDLGHSIAASEYAQQAMDVFAGLNLPGAARTGDFLLGLA